MVLLTIFIQLQWVTKNYKASERQLERDIQTSFDLTVADYFTNEDKRNTLGFLVEAEKFPEGKIDSLISGVVSVSEKANARKVLKIPSIDSLYEQASQELTSRKKNDTANRPEIKSIKIDGFKFPSSRKKDTSNVQKKYRSKVNEFLIVKDSLETEENISVTNLTIIDEEFKGSLNSVDGRFTISFTTKSLDLDVIDSLMQITLEKNEIQINYGFKYNDGTDDYEIGDLTGDQKIESKSPNLYNKTKLQMMYSGQGKTLFKRNLVEILLSFILCCVVIFCLYYMLWIIRKQKELSLIKNDLISNITHEFKTPIATASAALEGVQSFNTTGDVEKSNRYLDVGREQLTKLNLMVEKLLETATIDNEKLALQKTKFLLSGSLQESVDRYQKLTDKKLSLQLMDNHISFYGDEFHLENAINNLLDNAIKYGGDIITINAFEKSNVIKITVSDDGKNLKPKDAKYLFDKFYRIPSGDRHNIKGHGIGLFYTKAIIEKHGGSIKLDLNPTTFTIELPYE